MKLGCRTECRNRSDDRAIDFAGVLAADREQQAPQRRVAGTSRFHRLTVHFAGGIDIPLTLHIILFLLCLLGKRVPGLDAPTRRA